MSHHLPLHAVIVLHVMFYICYTSRYILCGLFSFCLNSSSYFFFLYSLSCTFLYCLNFFLLFDFSSFLTCLSFFFHCYFFFPFFLPSSHPSLYLFFYSIHLSQLCLSIYLSICLRLVTVQRPNSTSQRFSFSLQQYCNGGDLADYLQGE